MQLATTSTTALGAPGAGPHATVLLGHADPGSFNAALARAYAEGFSGAGGTIETIDLASLDFDPVLRAGYRGDQPLEPDLLRLRESIERARHVVWVFPTYWASMPAIVRAAIDRTFLPGWAFRYEKGRALPRGLLAGRSARVITTMDSPSWWYALAHHRSLHGSLGTATLTFCGFAPVSFTTIHRVRDLDERATRAWVERAGRIAREDANRVRRPMSRKALAGP